MADIWSKEKRSEVMGRVRSKHNKSTELLLIAQFKYLHITGWRRNYKVKGKPDFVFHQQKVAVFADGCFWHGHDCRVFQPKTNEEYWINKLERNKAHDIEVTAHLKKLGWNVVRVWECEIKKGIAIRKIIDALQEGAIIKELESVPTSVYDSEYIFDDRLVDLEIDIDE